jgi:hypothetical protein
MEKLDLCEIEQSWHYKIQFVTQDTTKLKELCSFQNKYFKQSSRFVICCLWGLLLSKLLQVQYGFCKFKMANLRTLATSKLQQRYKSLWTFQSTLVAECLPLHRMTECCQVPEQTVPVQVISTGILLLTTVT